MTESRPPSSIAHEFVETLSVEEAAAMLGVHERTVRRAIARGDLVARKRGRSLAITHASLAEFARRRGQRGPDGARLRSRALPVPPTAFIGRDQLIESLSAMLVTGPDRLLTLVGPGGVGKTRLSLHVLQRVMPAFAGATAFVSMAAVEVPELVLPAIVDALDLPPHQSLEPIEQLQRFFGATRFLLVLDNLEHVRDAGPAIAALVAGCPSLVVLVTSRVRLQVTGERCCTVPPLTGPPAQDGPGIDDLDAIAASEAVRLFAARAELVIPDFTITHANASPVSAICLRLDGLPLALELAASRLRHFGLHDLRVRLERALPLLVGGPRDAPLRLQTMRDAIDWSYGLLSEDEQTLFRRVAVFVGGFTIDAAMQTVRDRRQRPPESFDAVETLAAHDALVEQLSALVDQSLLRLEAAREPQDPGTHSRYAMFETIREFGLEQLAIANEERRFRDAHADWCLALARQSDGEMRSMSHARSFETIEQELPNVRAALTWLLAQRESARGLALVSALTWFWTSRGYLREAALWMDAFLALPPGTAPGERAQVLMEAATIAQWQGDNAAAAVHSQNALSLYRDTGDELGMAYALRQLGSIAIKQGDLEEAATKLAASEPTLLAEGTPWDAGFARYLAGRLAMARSDVTEALHAFTEAAATFQALGNEEYFAAARCQQGTAFVAQARLAEARSAFVEGLEIAMEYNQPFWIAWSLAGAADLAFRESRSALADRFFVAARRLVIQNGLEAYDAIPIELGKRLGISEVEAFPSLSQDFERQILAEARQFLRAPNEQHDRMADNGASESGSTALTPRERQVLALLTQGLTDKEIARRLDISRLTAVNHVAAVRRKLGVPSRTAAAALAIQHRLVD